MVIWVAPKAHGAASNKRRSVSLFDVVQGHERLWAPTPMTKTAGERESHVHTVIQRVRSMLPPVLCGRQGSLVCCVNGSFQTRRGQILRYDLSDFEAGDSLHACEAGRARLRSMLDFKVSGTPSTSSNLNALFSPDRRILYWTFWNCVRRVVPAIVEWPWFLYFRRVQGLRNGPGG